MLSHLLLVRFEHVPDVSERLLCLILRCRKNVDVVFRHAVGLGQQAKVLKSEIPVLAGSTTDIHKRDREPQLTVCTVCAVVQREHKLFPREQSERKVFLIAQILGELVRVDCQRFLCEDPFHEIAKL